MVKPPAEAILYELDACDDPRMVAVMINVLNNSHSRLDSTTSVAMNVLRLVRNMSPLTA